MNDQEQISGKVVSDLVRQMGDEEKSGNVKFFDDLLADTFRFRRASGVNADKTTFLKDLANSANTYPSFRRSFRHGSMKMLL